MTRNTKKFLSILLFLSLLIFFVCRLLDSGEEASAQLAFPEKIKTRHYLNADGEKESRRIVEYHHDGWTEKSVTIEFEDGGQLVTTFFEDGSPESLVEYYPFTASQSRVLKRKITYLKGNPRTVIRAQFNRPDGTVLAKGSWLGEGTFEQFEYDSSGRHVERREVYLTSGEIVYRINFDGSPSGAKVENLLPDSTHTVSFRTDGTRVQRLRSFENSNNELFQYFQEDGLTLDHVVFRYDEIGAVYLNSDGSLNEAWRFEDGKFQVVIYRPGTMPIGTDFTNVPLSGVRYKQYWTERHGLEPVLTQVDEYRLGGTVYRKLYFDDGELSKAEIVDRFGNVAQRFLLKPSEEDDSGIKLIIPYFEYTPPKITYNQDSIKLSVRQDPRSKVGSPVEEYYPYEGYYDDMEDSDAPVQESLVFP